MVSGEISDLWSLLGTKSISGVSLFVLGVKKRGKYDTETLLLPLRKVNYLCRAGNPPAKLLPSLEGFWLPCLRIFCGLDLCPEGIV